MIDCWLCVFFSKEKPKALPNEFVQMNISFITQLAGDSYIIHGLRLKAEGEKSLSWLRNSLFLLVPKNKATFLAQQDQAGSYMWITVKLLIII